MKPLVFISYAKTESAIADALKQLVETSFLNMIDVFVASDPTSIEMGRKWLEEITRALKGCAVEIIIASPDSVKRPWINFEAGAAWLRDIPVIPLCHSGMTPGKLPPPLSSLQGATATEENELRLIFPVLAKAIGCRLPEIDYQDLIGMVVDFEEQSKQLDRFAARSPIADIGGLLQHELAALVEIGEQLIGPTDTVPAIRVIDAMVELGWSKLAFNLGVNGLVRKGLAESLNEADQFERYVALRPTEEGWAWLLENHELLRLKTEASVSAKKTKSVEEDPF